LRIVVQRKGFLLVTNNTREAFKTVKEREWKSM